MFKKGFWIIGVILFSLAIFLPGFSKLQELNDKNRDLEIKIRRLSLENAMLEQQIKRIENDPTYQEKIARDKMGVVKKGEIPVKMIPDEREQ